MCTKSLREAKSFPTNRANVRLVVGVNLHVNISVPDLREAPFAVGKLALVRLELQVDGIDVKPQMFGPLEARLAFIAFVLSRCFFLLDVNQNVALQKTLQLEGLLAEVAEVSRRQLLLGDRLADAVRGAFVVFDGTLLVEAARTARMVALEGTILGVAEVSLEVRSER